ncbi:protein BTN1-like [Stylophora pistillata]|uniref:protein BTN1-like n=1 Tax=Stylophora pistillata TaxID=50429 RepID=UPI000C05282E|nr:protein BTN1-like [Stylophora pistillata]
MDHETETCTMNSAGSDSELDPVRNESEMSHIIEDEQPLHIFAFGVFGFILQTFFSIGISASQDILEETLVPTPSLLISASLPFFVITSFLPCFVLKLSHKALLVPVVGLGITGVLSCALVEAVILRVTGVIVVSTGVTIGEVTFVSMTALYIDTAMSSYSAGTGVRFIAGPLGLFKIISYMLNAFLLHFCIFTQARILPSIWVLLKEEIIDMINHKGIAYNVLNTEKSSVEDNLSRDEKRTLIWHNLHPMLACFVGYFSEFLTLTGGRSYISILFILNSKCPPVIARTWILSALLLGLFIFSTLASWYYFLHSVWIVLFLIFNVGLLAGSLYPNTFLMVTSGDGVKGKAFSRGFLSFGPSAGVLMAGLVGLVLEPTLREHCLQSAEFRDFCFTRSMGGWNKSTLCLR